jgi:Uma2 family endonuclease
MRSTRPSIPWYSPTCWWVCGERKISEPGVPGASDFVVEVLSPAIAGHDQVKKRRIYERHGVQEYWLVHPTDRVLIVYRLMGTEYGKPDLQELTGETLVGVLPGVTILWDALAARLPRPEY